jgi:hypothetical protein
MRGSNVGKWSAVAVTGLCGALFIGYRVDSRADDKTESAIKPGIAEARTLVKSLEARVKSAEEDLAKAKALLAVLEPAPAPVAAVEKDETDSVEGVWRIVGIGGNGNGGDFRKPPYDEYKIMSAGHYLWLSFDPNSGKVLRSGGGTYSLKGEVYAAHVDYSNATDLRAVASQEYAGTSRLDGKRLFHFGTMTNGATFDELWEKVN